MSADRPAIGSRRTTWPAALPLQQAADTLRAGGTDVPERLVKPLADLLEEYANAMSWLAPFNENEGGYGQWVTVMRVAALVNGITP